MILLLVQDTVPKTNSLLYVDLTDTVHRAPVDI